MRPFALIAFMSLAACPSSRGPSPTAPVMPDVVRLASDTAEYHVVEHRRTGHTVRGQPLVSSGRRDVWLAGALTPASGGLTARWVLDSIVVAAADPLGPPETGTARGTTFSAMVGENGSTGQVDVDRERTELLDAVGERLQGLLPRLPAGGARIGASWTDTTEHGRRAGGIAVTARTVGRRRAAGWTTWAGAPALEIVSEGDYILTGRGEHAGQEVELEGTGRRHARHYLDPSGRLLGAIGSDSVTLEVRLVAGGLVIPIRQWSADTVEAWR
jgi:hypothetical protein